jgi:ribosomal protein S18
MSERADRLKHKAEQLERDYKNWTNSFNCSQRLDAAKQLIETMNYDDVRWLQHYCTKRMGELVENGMLRGDK